MICLLLVFALAALAFPASSHAAQPPQLVPSVSAPSAVLMEKVTGQLIYEKNSKEHLHPASVTKIMTMLLIVEDIEAGTIKLEDIVTASERAASFGGSCVYLAQGEKMSVSDMLKCIAVVSANDCAVAMAEHISGSEEAFVGRMNKRAAELGMKDTNFTNCTGLFDDDNHYTCAHDVAIMSRQLIAHELIKNYTTIWMDSIRNGEFELSNTNKLVYWYDGCTGLKTGYTAKAGYCLSATAERDGVEYIAVVMKGESSDSRNYDAEQMLSFAFANYALCSLKGDTEAPEIPVELGKSESVKTFFGGDEFKLLPRTDAALTYELACENSVKAPVKRGDRLGMLTVRAGENTVATIPLLAAEDVDRPGYFGILGRLAGSMLGL